MPAANPITPFIDSRDVRKLPDRCENCRMGHSFLFPFGNPTQRVCANCAFADLAATDRKALDAVIGVIRSSRICAYCGDYGRDVEHVMPRRAHMPTWTVRACSECNGIAGGRIFGCFAEKREFIRTRLERKYKKILAMPEWTDDEIRELGGRTRQWIRGCQFMAHWVRSRIEFDVTFDSMIDIPAPPEKPLFTEVR